MLVWLIGLIVISLSGSIFSDLQLYVYGNNLLTWTKYKGFDPSSISNSNVLRPGIDNGRYPTAREIGFGLNVNF